MLMVGAAAKINPERIANAAGRLFLDAPAVARTVAGRPAARRTATRAAESVVSRGSRFSRAGTRLAGMSTKKKVVMGLGVAAGMSTVHNNKMSRTRHQRTSASGIYGF